MEWVRKIKPLVFMVSLLPLCWAVYLVLSNQLGPDPANTLPRLLGEWALIFLCITLSITPVRRWFKWNKLIRFRRMLGLFVLFYALLHSVAYLAFMLGWQWATLAEDLIERPYIIVGFLALLILVALGVTSPKSMMRKMGKNWQRLHRLVYVVAGLAVLHFFWLVKSDYTEPALYGAIAFSLLLFRIKRLSFSKALNR